MIKDYIHTLMEKFPYHDYCIDKEIAHHCVLEKMIENYDEAGNPNVSSAQFNEAMIKAQHESLKTIMKKLSDSGFVQAVVKEKGKFTYELTDLGKHLTKIIYAFK